MVNRFLSVDYNDNNSNHDNNTVLVFDGHMDVLSLYISYIWINVGRVLRKFSGGLTQNRTPLYFLHKFVLVFWQRHGC